MPSFTPSASSPDASPPSASPPDACTLRVRRNASARLDVVVPVGPGDQAWQQLLPQLAAQLEVSTHRRTALNMERYLVFALDAEAHAARLWLQENQLDAHVVLSAQGRGLQLNAGIAAGENDWVWCLHADTRCSAQALQRVSQLLMRSPPARALYFFELSFFDGKGMPMWLNALGVWLRARVFGIVFGDQGLLMRREQLVQVGEYCADAAGEDHAFVARARALGFSLKPIGAWLQTSARKYARLGWWRVTRTHLRQTFSQMHRFNRPHGVDSSSK